MKATIPKEGTQQFRVLRMLATRKEVSGLDIVLEEMITRGASRVDELIDKGWKIRKIKNGWKKNTFGELVKVFDSYEMTSWIQKSYFRITA